MEPPVALDPPPLFGAPPVEDPPPTPTPSGSDDAGESEPPPQPVSSDPTASDAASRVTRQSGFRERMILSIDLESIGIQEALFFPTAV